MPGPGAGESAGAGAWNANFYYEWNIGEELNRFEGSLGFLFLSVINISISTILSSLGKWGGCSPSVEGDLTFV